MPIAVMRSDAQVSSFESELRIKTGKLAELSDQRDAKTVIDDFPHFKVDNPLGPREAVRTLSVPIDGGNTGDLYGSTTVEVNP